MKFIKSTGIILMTVISITVLTNCGTTSTYTSDVQYSNPSWAPPYYTGVRYYYMPDIEVYYDLSGQEFVYLENGQWLFSRSLPLIYSGYDLDNGFVISLDFNVYQPWMHHQYYISHYPRYYYRNTYREDERVHMRGFSENERKPIYHRGEVKPRVNEIRKEEKIEKRNEFSRQPQNPNYYGKDIGRPVKVKPEMKENKKIVKKEIKREEKKEIKKEIKKEDKRDDRKERRPR